MDVGAPLVANGQAPELPDPSQRPFDHPAVPTQSLAGVDAFAGNPSTDDSLPQVSAAAGNVVGFVRTEQFPRLDKVFADAGYQGKLEEWTAEELGVVLQIVPKLAGQSTFVILPKRWIVERTFAWLMRYRRLRSEYETTVQSSVGWIYAAMIHRMVRLLTPASHHSAEKNAATSWDQSSGCSIAAK